MSSTDKEEWRVRVEGALASYEAQLHTCVANLDKLTKHLSKLTLGTELLQPQDVSPALAPSPVSPGIRDTPICIPERYSGEPTSCRAFLMQCNLQFKYQPSAFPNDSAKVAFILSLLSGPAREWGAAEMDRNSSICGSLADFSKELINTFDPAKPQKEAAIRLARLTQGRRTVSEYAVEFRTLAAICDWNKSAWRDMFYAGLAEKIKDELAAREWPEQFDKLVEMAVSIDRRWTERQRERELSSRSLTSRFPPTQLPKYKTVQREFRNSVRLDRHPHGPTDELKPEPMQIGRSGLTPEERSRRFKDNLCLYCGEPAHRVASCPALLKGKAQQPGGDRC
uniref:Retrotransposon gag domain-containing protein n=1 Tax=Mastacembelus armatus TaxID=205130 RepID=A0A7N8WLZ3_9TELE